VGLNVMVDETFLFPGLVIIVHAVIFCIVLSYHAYEPYFMFKLLTFAFYSNITYAQCIILTVPLRLSLTSVI